jgi:PKD repeat protein
LTSGYYLIQVEHWDPWAYGCTTEYGLSIVGTEPTPYTPVQAAFTASPTSGVAPLTATFTNTSSGVYTETLWTFGDGAISSQESPTHTYTATGPYTITLTINGPGGTDTVTRTNLITTYAPVQAGFTAWPTSGAAPLTVTFTNTSSGDYDTSLWHFGDGVTGTLENLTHTYGVAGTYTVTLMVSGPGGDQSTVRPGLINVSVAEPSDQRLYLPLVMRNHP